MILERLAAAAEEPLVVFKGASVATSCPGSGRPALFRDIDVLAGDAERVHRRLVAAGFAQLRPTSYYDDRHHLAPLVVPQLPLLVEVHRRPESVTGSSPPPATSIVERRVPAPLRVDGIRFPRTDRARRRGRRSDDDRATARQSSSR